MARHRGSCVASVAKLVASASHHASGALAFVFSEAQRLCSHIAVSVSPIGKFVMESASLTVECARSVLHLLSNFELNYKIKINIMKLEWQENLKF